MKKRLKALEKELFSIYNEIKELHPGLHHLNFGVSTYKTGDTTLSGFYHIGSDCVHYTNINELDTLNRKFNTSKGRNK